MSQILLIGFIAYLYGVYKTYKYLKSLGVKETRGVIFLRIIFSLNWFIFLIAVLIIGIVSITCKNLTRGKVCLPKKKLKPSED
jgi:hypothetical protein